MKETNFLEFYLRLKLKRRSEIPRSLDLWKRERRGRTRSRGSPGSCRSVCKQRCRRRPSATARGGGPPPSRLWPSTCSSPYCRRISASPSPPSASDLAAATPNPTPRSSFPQSRGDFTPPRIFRFFFRVFLEYK